MGRLGEGGLHGRDEAGFGRLVVFGLRSHMERLRGFDVKSDGEEAAGSVRGKLLLLVLMRPMVTTVFPAGIF